MENKKTFFELYRYLAINFENPIKINYIKPESIEVDNGKEKVMVILKQGDKLSINTHYNLSSESISIRNLVVNHLMKPENNFGELIIAADNLKVERRILENKDNKQ
ncbi:MAG: hypothetical protein HRU03_07355 [Nanoarchaeales archaeon]|nr:hypothetical protein [Nanoarchaeales archaeon]